MVISLWNEQNGLYAFLDKLDESTTDLIIISPKGKILHAETIEKPIDEVINHLQEQGFEKMK